MSAPDLLYTADEDDLRSAVRRLLEARSPWQDVLARTESDQPTDRDLWRRLAEIGVAGLAVPEAAGGAGASWREVAVVAEEAGRAVAPVPLLTSGVIATAVLLAVGDDELLGELASGERTAALVVPLSASADDPRLDAVRLNGDRLTGTVTSVADAAGADVLLVPATGPDGRSVLVALDGGAEGVTRSSIVAFDLTRPLADVRLDGARGRVVADGDAVAGAVRHGLLVGAAMLASEQLGIAERCLELTVAYLRTRYQFGRPIGSFQGLKHRLADLWTSISQARAVARYAASCVADGDPDSGIAVSVAQAHVSAVAVRAAEECIQMHGGIGFTWEHPAHLYLKRAKSDAIALGTADAHRTALAALVDLPAA